MRYTIHIIIFILSGLFFPTCSNTTGDSENVLVLNTDEASEFKLSEIASTVSYIKLDTANTQHIGIVSKLIFHNGNYYILDSEQAIALFVYNEKGDFLYSIADYGRGPGELTAPRDFNIVNDKIIIYDLAQLKLSIFNAVNGSHIDDVKLNSIPSKFHVMNNEYIFFNNNSISGKDNYNIVVTDSSLIIKEEYLKINPGLKNYIVELPSTFYQYNSNIYITIPNDYTIYKMTIKDGENLFIPYLYVDFGDKKTDNKFYKSNTSNIERRKLLEISAHWISNYYENDNYMYFNYWLGEKMHYYFKSKISSKEIHTNVDNFNDDIGGGPLTGWPSAFMGNTLIWSSNPHELFDYLKKKKEGLSEQQWMEFQTKNQKLISFSESLTENDNPYLTLIELDF